METKDGYIEIEKSSRWGTTYMIAWNKREFRFSSDFQKIYKLEKKEFVNIFVNKEERKIVFVFYEKLNGDNLFKVSRTNSKAASCSSIRARGVLREDSNLKKEFGSNQINKIKFREIEAIELTL